MSPSTGGGPKRRFAIVAARFNQTVTEKLVQGCLDGFAARGVSGSDIEVVWVPGAFEIPLVADRLAASGSFSAIVCLGAIVRGDTAHFELVAEQAARGIAQVALNRSLPVIFEVLATDDLAQAQERAGGAHGNKGWEAAESALEMTDLLASLP